MENVDFIESSFFEDVKQSITFNPVLVQYYNNLAEDSKSTISDNDILPFWLKRKQCGCDRFLSRASSLSSCCKFWTVDFYRAHNVKDIVKVNLCRDKFCYNCQSLLASKRYLRFTPQLDKYKNDYTLLHVVFTVPNVKSDMLQITLDNMYQAFPHLIEFFKGKKKVRDVDFNQYGYVGAVRSLEITYNKQEDSYHPHFHCIFVMRKNLDLNYFRTNKYSFSNGKFVKGFSRFEILLQNVWYLLLHHERVTYDSINNLSLGYDVSAIPAEGHYHEVFKYVCKEGFDPQKGSYVYDEPVFRTLFFSLFSRRIIQGYGVLHNFADLDGEVLEIDLEQFYEDYIKSLRRLELPVQSIESLEQVIEGSCRSKYFSKSNLKKLLIENRRLEGVTGEGSSLPRTEAINE